MKRTLLILTLLLPLSLHAQESTGGYKELFKSTNRGLALAMNLGGIADINSHYELGVGASLCMYGVFFDFLLSGPSYGSSKSVGEWTDSMLYSLHGGYQVPITRQFIITPLLGLAVYSEGKTNGYHYTVTSTGDISNTYMASSVYKRFDYGACLTFIIPNSSFKIDLSATRYTFSVGVGFRMIN